MERLHAEAAKGVCHAKKDACLQCILSCVTGAGFTLYEFLDEPMHMSDHTTSEIIHAWAVKTTGEILAQSLQSVCAYTGVVE